MPVRVISANHGANPIQRRFATDGFEILKTPCKDITSDDIKVLQSSFNDVSLPSSMYASSNGFVRSIISAYSEHHHLTFRPEDIWFAILTQISSYISAHAEDLRDKFVEHKGQKELVIEYGSGNRYSVDFGAFAYQMSKILEDNIIDQEYRDWVLPKFTTL